MKKRSGTRRRYRGRSKQVARRQAAAPQAAGLQAAAPAGTPTKPMVMVPPVGGVSHRQVLSDIRKIGIIGAAALIVLLVLFIVWR